MAGMVDLLGLIGLVDKILRLKQRVRGIPDEVSEVLEVVSSACVDLEALSGVLGGHRESFGDKHGILGVLDADVNALYSALLQLETFIEDHAPSNDPDATPLDVAGRTVAWVAREYRGDTAGKLLKDIATRMERIEKSKTSLLLVATSAIARNGSVTGRVAPVGGSGVPAGCGAGFRNPFEDPRRDSGPRTNTQTPPNDESLLSSRDSTWSSTTCVESVAETVGPPSTIPSGKSSRPAFVLNGKAEMYDGPLSSPGRPFASPN